MIKKYRNEILTYTSIALGLIFVLLYFLFIFNTKRIKEINIENYTISNYQDYVYNIKSSENNADYLSLEGYIYEKESKIEKSAIHLILYDKQEKKAYMFPTYVRNMMSDGVNKEVSWSGFKAYVEKAKIKEMDDYSIYLLVDFNDVEKLVDLKLNLKDTIE